MSECRFDPYSSACLVHSFIGIEAGPYHFAALCDVGAGALREQANRWMSNFEEAVKVADKLRREIAEAKTLLCGAGLIFESISSGAIEAREISSQAQTAADEIGRFVAAAETKK